MKTNKKIGIRAVVISVLVTVMLVAPSIISTIVITSDGIYDTDY